MDAALRHLVPVVSLWGRLAFLVIALLAMTQCAGTYNTLDCTGNLDVKVEPVMGSGLDGVKVEFVAQKYDAAEVAIGPAMRIEKLVDSRGTASNSWRFRLEIGEGFAVHTRVIPPNWHDYAPSETVRFDWTMFDKVVEGKPEITKQVVLKLSKE